MNARAQVPNFDATARARLAKLLAMFSSSSSDGEALNAARAADRLVRSCGVTWADVVCRYPPAPAPRKAPKATKDWRDVCREVAADKNESAWARSFCADILKFSAVDLSRRQLAALREILEARRQRTGRASR
jgi:hypothetical protein